MGLEALGHIVLSAATAADGLAATALQAPDAVLLDLGLPDLDGVEVCRRLRAWSSVPVVVLSADGTEERKVAAFDAGADDYMTKPFGMRELDARIRVAERHRQAAAAGEEPARIAVGPLDIDMVHHEVRNDGELVDLTATEFAFLSFLARHAGKMCTHRMILEHVWGDRYANEVGYLRAYAYRLRRKLGDQANRLLVTDPGVGYKLEGSARGPGEVASGP